MTTGKYIIITVEVFILFSIGVLAMDNIPRSNLNMTPSYNLTELSVLDFADGNFISSWGADNISILANESAIKFTDDIHIFASGTEVLTILEQGLVGVNVTNPPEALSVRGQIYSVGTGVNSGFAFAHHTIYEDTDNLGLHINLVVNGYFNMGGLFRLWRTDSPTACAATYEGAMYYDSSLNEPCYCNGSSWTQFIGTGVC